MVHQPPPNLKFAYVYGHTKNGWGKKQSIGVTLKSLSLLAFFWSCSMSEKFQNLIPSVIPRVNSKKKVSEVLIKC